MYIFYWIKELYAMMNKHYPDKQFQEVPPHRRYMKKQVSFDSPPPKQIVNLDESDNVTDTTHHETKRYSGFQK